MADSEKRYVTSQVVGVVYTDLVCYIIPGFLLTCAFIGALGVGSAVLNWIATLTAGAGLVVSLALVALCFSLGLALSLIRWFGVTRGGNASFGNLIQGRVPRSVLKRLPLPPIVLQEARRRIRCDLRDLGLIDSQTCEVLNARDSDAVDAQKNQTEQRELLPNPEQLDKNLFDSYWHIMRGDLRESSLNLFPYLDRWRDIETARENMLIACQIALVGVVVREVLYGQLRWACVSFGAAGFLCILVIRRWLLPRYTYYLMFPVLLRYLVGDLGRSASIPRKNGGETIVEPKRITHASTGRPTSPSAR